MDQVDSDAAAETIRVGLVDDQAMVRAGFGMLIGSQDDMTVAWQASDGDEVPGKPPADIVLMDVQMARVDGISATRDLLARDSDVKVVMLTTFDDFDFVQGAIAAGASGFLLKDAEPDDLLSAVRTVCSGEAVLAPRVTSQLLQRMGTGEALGRTAKSATAGQNQPTAEGADTGQRAVGQEASFPVTEPLAADLTPRECEILRLIALGYSNTDIAEEEFVSMATVKTHVRHILTKTASRDRVHAVLYAYRTGVVSVDELLTHPQG